MACVASSTKERISIISAQAFAQLVLNLQSHHLGGLHWHIDAIQILFGNIPLGLIILRNKG
jgi:hypothetical protein